MPQFPGEGAINEKLRLLKTHQLCIVMENIQLELDRRERKNDVRLAGQAKSHREKLLAEAFLHAKHGMLLNNPKETVIQELQVLFQGALVAQEQPLFANDLTLLELAILERFDLGAFLLLETVEAVA